MSPFSSKMSRFLPGIFTIRFIAINAVAIISWFILRQKIVGTIGLHAAIDLALAIFIGGAVAAALMSSGAAGRMEELADRNKFLNDILNSFQDGIVIFDNEKKIVRANPVVEEWFKDKLPLEGKTCHDLFGINGHSACPAENVLRTGKEERSAMEINISGNGPSWVSISSYPLIDSFGRGVAGVIQYMRDVTGLVNAQKALTDSEKKYRAVFDSSKEAMLLTDREGNIVEANRKALEMTGRQHKELIGKHHLAIHPPQERENYANLFRAAIENEAPISGDICVLREGGVKVPVELSAVSILPGGKRNVIVLKDMTAARQDEAHIKRQFEMLNALYAVDNAITASLDLRVTLNVLLEQALTQLKVDAACVLLMDPETLTLKYVAGRGFSSFRPGAMPLQRLGQGNAGQAAFSRRIVHLEKSGISKDKSASFPGAEVFADYYAVPLMAKGQVKGVLELYHKSSKETDVDWAEFLDALASQAAIAIENAALFADLQRTNTDLALAYDSTLEGWSRALDLRDRETEGHSARVTEMAMELARKVGMSEQSLVHVRRGALLHDIGKMAIPDNILFKPGPLDADEKEVMKKHPAYALDLLTPIHYLKPALSIPFLHHEKWDGSGYPHGLKGQQIPLAARVFAIADVWDALSSDRPYREAWPKEKVLDYMRAGSGSHFDPDIINTFLDMAQA